MNAYLAWSAELEALATRRETARMEAMTRQWLEKNASLSVRNPVGGLVLQETVFAFAKVTESYWAAEDQRTALLRRLETAAGAPPARPSTPAPPAP